MSVRQLAAVAPAARSSAAGAAPRSGRCAPGRRAAPSARSRVRISPAARVVKVTASTSVGVVDAGGDAVGDPVGDRPGLAGAGAGQHPDRPAQRLGDLALLGVERVEEVGGSQARRHAAGTTPAVRMVRLGDDRPDPRCRRTDSPPMSARFTMYSTPWCGYCHRLKSQLDREGIAYEVVDIEQHPEAAADRRAGQRRQPDRADAGLRRRHRADQPVARAGQGEARRARLTSSRSAPAGSPAGRAAGRRTSASTSERLIEMPPGSTSVPASASALISSRVNQRASSISSPSTSISVVTRAGEEAEHQAGRERPRLVAEVGHVADHDADLLQRPRGVRRPRGVSPGSHEAGQRRVAALGPDRLPAEQAALVVGRLAEVTSMITAGSVRGNCGVPHSCTRSTWPAARGLERAAAARAEPVANGATRPAPSAWKTSGAPASAWSARCGSSAAQRRPSSSGSPARLGRVDDHREPGTAVAARRAAPAARRARPPARPSRPRRRTGRIRVAGHDQHPGRPGRPSARSSQASSVRRPPTRSCACADSAMSTAYVAGKLTPTHGDEPTAS